MELSTGRGGVRMSVRGMVEVNKISGMRHARRDVDIDRLHVK